MNQIEQAEFFRRDYLEAADGLLQAEAEFQAIAVAIRQVADWLKTWQENALNSANRYDGLPDKIPTVHDLRNGLDKWALAWMDVERRWRKVPVESRLALRTPAELLKAKRGAA